MKVLAILLTLFFLFQNCQNDNSDSDKIGLLTLTTLNNNTCDLTEPSYLHPDTYKLLGIWIATDSNNTKIYYDFYATVAMFNVYMPEFATMSKGLNYQWKVDGTNLQMAVCGSPTGSWSSKLYFLDDSASPPVFYLEVDNSLPYYKN
ncbi:hypothetical protein [Leptospira licerasiae]|uniref:hypothetical protein n=1 Tax=Leptospira licerasiae TaxID=447106 RepID=UPI0030167DE4